MKSFAIGTFVIVLLLLWTNVSYAQILKDLVPNILYSPHKSHPVVITSPKKGQQVPVGRNLTIQGTSTGSMASHCKVYVIVNGVKPYRLANGTGPGGAADYTKWSFLLNSKYATIKEGSSNKITAKYICNNNPSQRSFYGLNITGIKA
jgi:Big-like domain-containing protein